MSIDYLTLDEIKELITSLKASNTSSDHVFTVGERYLIRTVTMFIVGKLEQVTENELVLSSASWVADTGRFNDALKNGSFTDVEPFINDVIVGRRALIDATIWNHKL